MMHQLKTHPKAFQATWERKKLYEVREDDRNFEVGDSVQLLEFDPCAECNGGGRVWDNGDMTDCGCEKPHGTFTGRVIAGQITYKTEGGEFGLPEETCVFSFDPQRFFSKGSVEVSREKKR